MSSPRLLDAFEARAVSKPDVVAVRWRRQPYADIDLTWRDLLERANALASTLAAAGGRLAGRCAVELSDHPDVVPLMLAIWQAGGVVVPVDLEWGSGLRERVLAHSSADVLVAFEPAPVVTLRRPSGVAPPLPEATAMISYTSGTTSDPKGVVLTHGNLTAAYTAGAAAIEASIGYRPRR